MFTRTTISIPKELKHRMDAAPSTNWSALACRAFRAGLDDQYAKALPANYRSRVVAAWESASENEQHFHQTVDYTNHNRQEWMRGYLAGIRSGLLVALKMLDSESQRGPWWEE